MEVVADVIIDEFASVVSLLLSTAVLVLSRIMKQYIKEVRLLTGAAIFVLWFNAANKMFESEAYM